MKCAFSALLPRLVFLLTLCGEDISEKANNWIIQYRQLHPFRSLLVAVKLGVLRHLVYASLTKCLPVPHMQPPF